LKRKFFTPLKVGILVATIAYFLFTLHAMFTISWIGEWEGLPEPLATWIFVTDVAAGVFLVFRFIASFIATSTAILYFAKKGLAQTTTNKLLRVVLVFEGLYWIGLLPSGIWGLLPSSGTFSTSLLLSTGIPCTVASIGIPTAIFMLVYKLNPNKPQKEPIKWALIAGTLYVVAFWLNNSGMWLITMMNSGIGYVTNSAVYMTSYISTLAGLLALALFTAYFAKKSIGTQQVTDLKLKTVGGIITALGVYFLWNYLAWIFFGGWNEWYAWFLGHNLDLWMLTLPLVGLPLLFVNQKERAPKNSG